MGINGVSGYAQQAVQQLNNARQNPTQVNNRQSLQQINSGRLDSDGDYDGDTGMDKDNDSSVKSAKSLSPYVGQNINITA